MLVSFCERQKNNSFAWKDNCIQARIWGFGLGELSLKIARFFKRPFPALEVQDADGVDNHQKLLSEQFDVFGRVRQIFFTLIILGPLPAFLESTSLFFPFLSSFIFLIFR